MIPYYADESVTLYHGEALAVLASLPTGSVDAVVVEQVEHFAEVALTRIREASGQAVARGSQPALDFGEGA